MAARGWWGDGPSPAERWPGVTIEIDTCGGRYYFDEETADRACEFFPRFLFHLRGAMQNEPFELLPWQRDLVIRPLFGWKRTADGRRRFRELFLAIPKKQGKSLIASGIGLYVLHCDDEPGAEVVAAAKDRKQAGLVFDDARDLNAASKALARRSETYRRAIVVPSTRSSFKVVSSDVGGQHGPNIHCLIFDEFHTQPNRLLFETLEKGTASRRQPLVVIITTAGDDPDTICHERWDFARSVISGKLADETLLPVIFEAREAEDWRAPETWRRVNPSIGHSVPLEYYEREVALAIEEPRRQNAFKQLHLNMWTRQREVWIPFEWWKACPELPDAGVLRGRPVAAGLDLSSTTDLTALAVVLRLAPTTSEVLKIETQEEDESDAARRMRKISLAINYDLAVVPYLWMPEERVGERSREDRIDYWQWVRDGHLRTTPGAIVDYDAIFRAIVDEIAPTWGLKQIGFDPWNATQFALQLEKCGFEAVEVRQGPRTLSAACKVFYALTKAGRVHHPHNAAMDWCVANVGVKEDENENIRPIKTSKRKRIDGVVAAVTGLSRLMVMPDRTGPYAHRGVRSV